MIESKRLSIISAVIMTFAVIMAFLLVGLAHSPAADKYSAASVPAYADKVFGADVITVDISADEDEWQDMLDNALNEQYISADIAVNGTKFSNVGIRPKGNNSLQQVASSDSDRYSFKIKFDEYIDGQTCFGLDMLVLNNMLGDATYMKEYTAFDMMKYMGIETPYFSYASITVNGKAQGLYFALEAYNDSYEQRVSGSEKGVLYNVKSDMGDKGFDEKDGGDNFPEGPVPGNFDSENTPDDFAPGDFDPENAPGNFIRENGRNPDFTGGKGKMPSDSDFDKEAADTDFGANDGNNMGFGRGGGNMGASSSGGSLIYTDDSIESYQAIFNNAVGGDSDEDDYRRVIAALKALNEGKDIEKYFDVDEILRYLAVHTVLVNLDSYSSNMGQNYYIYELDGVLQILPWDYNYAWGAFQGRNASDVVNFPIDTPVSGVEMSERPLIDKLLENDEYLEKYHLYLKELMDGYFADGKFSEKLDGLNDIIGSYVENDSTAFFGFDEYTAATQEFKKLAALRTESIYGQLDGTVPSTSSGQQEEPDKLTDASSVRLFALGGSWGR